MVPTMICRTYYIFGSYMYGFACFNFKDAKNSRTAVIDMDIQVYISSAHPSY